MKVEIEREEKREKKQENEERWKGGGREESARIARQRRGERKTGDKHYSREQVWE